MALRILLSTISAAIRSSSMWQPAGRNGNPAATCSARSLRVPPSRAQTVGRSGTPCGGGPRSRARCTRTCPAPAQTPSQLLNEQCGAVRGPQHEQGVHSWHVNALVEEVDGENDSHPTGRQIAKGRAPLLVGRIRPNRHRRNARCREDSRHESRMLDADAETPAPGPWSRRRRAVPAPQHQVRQGVVPSHQIGKPGHIIASPSPPRDLAQIEAIVDAKVRKRRQTLLVDGVPQPQLRRNPSVEPLEDWRDRRCVPAWPSDPAVQPALTCSSSRR